MKFWLILLAAVAALACEPASRPLPEVSNGAPAADVSPIGTWTGDCGGDTELILLDNGEITLNQGSLKAGTFHATGPDVLHAHLPGGDIDITYRRDGDDLMVKGISAEECRLSPPIQP
jgi:hypothetical protein